MLIFLLVATAPFVDAYCNGMRWKPRVPSKTYAPGWNGLAKTPPRGWRSWYAYYTSFTAPMIQRDIDALVAKNRTVRGWEGKVSLCDLGYCTAGLDEGWEGCGLGVNGTQHYLNGTPAVNPKKFPDGMKAMVKYGHDRGVKMGFYYNGCGCIEKREPASGWDINYQGDIKSLAEFGFDAVKFDGCGRMCNLTYYAELMAATGKAFEIENCHWGDCTQDDASSCPTTDWCPFNFYRTSGDSNNGMGTWYNNLQTTIRFQDWTNPVSRPGCWAYPDMLQVGRLGCSGHTSGCPPATEQILNWTRTHFAAFAIVSAPLVLSIDLKDENISPLLDIIGNKKAVAINQAWAGHPGTLLRTLPPAQPKPIPVKSGTAVAGVTPDPKDATQKGWTYDNSSSPVSVRHNGLCLATTGWDNPLFLTKCGNASTHQDFTYDPKSKQFRIMAPAPTKLYEACLQGSTALGKVDVYRCGGSNANELWTIDQSEGTICNANHICLAGRDKLNPPPPAVAGVQFWAKPLGGHEVAVLFINGGGLPYSAQVSMAELNVTAQMPSASAGFKATDVWSGDDAGPVTDGVWHTGSVAPLDSRFVVFASQ